MIDHVAEARRLRDRAEDCRTRADHSGSDDARRCWLEIATSYDLMASEEDNLRVMAVKIGGYT